MEKDSYEIKALIEITKRTKDLALHAVLSAVISACLADIQLDLGIFLIPFVIKLEKEVDQIIKDSGVNN